MNNKTTIIENENILRMAKMCYKKAMSVGTFVDWKDKNFIDPSYNFIEEQSEDYVTTRSYYSAYDLEKFPIVSVNGEHFIFHIICINRCECNNSIASDRFLRDKKTLHWK